LKDRRGKEKREEELTPEDRAKLSMKRLEVENGKTQRESS